MLWQTHRLSTQAPTARTSSVSGSSNINSTPDPSAASSPAGSSIRPIRVQLYVVGYERHTAASLLAELGEPEAIRKEVMGHRNIATTQRYTHLRPMHEIPAHERLADAVPIADLVTATRKRASGKAAGKNAGTPIRPEA